jgi:hypothetical protein
MDPARTLVVWGDGGFGPTSRGHAAAPNKKMQALLVHHGCALVTSSEYRSSKRSSCCHAALTGLRTQAHKVRGTRVTVHQCCACHHLVGRDASAAHVIADIFAYQQALPLSAPGDAPACTLPEWITEERTTL